MFCRECGKELKDGVKFCSGCGAAVQPAEAAQSSNTADERSNMAAQPAPLQVKPKKGKGGVIAIILVMMVLLLSGVGAALYFSGNDDKVSEGKKEEGKKPETATAFRQLSDYVNEELIPKYGSADLDKKIREVAMDEAYNVQDFMAYLNGIADTEICDLDGDGEEELLAFIYEAGKLSVSVYELMDGAVVKQGETSIEEQLSFMTMGDEVWALAEGKDGKYLYFSQHYYANYFLVDGVYDAAGLLRYDGEKLYMPLLVEHSWGSANFIYTATQFNGEKTTEEIVYDGEGLYGQQYDEEYYLKRMPELFAEYGIEIKAGQGLQVQVTTDAYEEILKCSQWVDGRINDRMKSDFCDTLVIHYNDEDSPLHAYERFLKGEETVRVRQDNMGENGLFASERTEWTLQDIVARIQETYGEMSDGELTPRIEYAYMDCGDDGYEEMQLKFAGLDIYAPEDDSDLTLIITGKNGHLEIIYAYETWARSYTEADYYGCITGGGSNGAGDHDFRMKYMDENANIHTVYEGRWLGGWWLSYISGDAYQKAFSAEEPELEISIYEIDGNTYYAVVDARHLSREEEIFIAACEEEGKEFISMETMEAMINERKKELGIKEEWNTGKGVCWNTWWCE